MNAAPSFGTTIRAERYRTAILREIGRLLGGAKCPVAARGLDFGAGDGWFAQELEARGLCGSVTCVDAGKSPAPFRDVMIYDGRHLPFEDCSFDLVYAMDVLHHCSDPRESLRQMIRKSSDAVIVKDHTYGTLAGRAALMALDELGNRGTGVRSPFHYQRNFSWDSVFKDEGFSLARRVHPLLCEERFFGRLTNQLHYLDLWRR